MGEKKPAKDGQFVLPGDYLGVIEEYLPGEGVKDENGNLIATRAGKVKIDKERMEISVEAVTDTPPLPEVGDVVIGQVIDVRPQSATVQLVKIEGKGDRAIAASTLATIHVSQVRNGFVEDMRREFRIGDVVRARVIAVGKGPIQLTTRAPDLGVVYALCSKCRTPLIKRGDQLICPRCGNVETRKLSTLYRKLVV